MFQVALGGYSLTSVGAFFDDVPIYSEPGFTIMSPLEIEVSKCDIFYILVRKRSDTSGSQFESLSTEETQRLIHCKLHKAPGQLLHQHLQRFWSE